MSARELANQYAYLWDGSQPGWACIRLYGHHVSVSLTFDAGNASNSEIMSMRRVLPGYASLSLTEVIARTRDRKSIHLGCFVSDEARSIVAACRLAKLPVFEAVVDSPQYMLANDVTGQRVTLEDNVQGAQVCNLAVQHGVPLRHVEY